MNAAATQRLGAGNLAALNAGAGSGGSSNQIVGKLDQLNETIASSNTEINITVEGADTFFPAWKKQNWTEKSRINSTENGIEYSFVEYLRG